MPTARKPKTEAPPEEPAENGLLERLAAEAKDKPLKVKIGLVQHHVGHVEKTGEVAFKSTRFKHMQEHGLIAELRPLCRAVRIGYIGGATEAGGWTQNGNTWVVDFALTVFDMDSDAELVRFYPNVGVDSADKGLNKAYTGAMKYALQKFFAVPTEDIDDNETVDIEAKPEQRPTQAAGVPDKDIEELRTLLGAQPAEFIGAAMNKVKTYGVDRLEQLTPKQFTEFANWVEHSLADRQAASE